MKKKFYRFFSVFVHGVWLILFSLSVWNFFRSASELKEILEKIESCNILLSQQSGEIKNLIRRTDEQSREISFMHSLTNIIPQDKGYLRTQKIISGEVQNLRKKVGRRLGNRIHIVVDTKANKLYLKKGLHLLLEADCSVGRGGILLDKKTGRRWEFVTPKGEFKVLKKIKNPVWTKPDWAFAESNEPIPSPDDPIRKVEGELGAYVLNLGDGYLIHGTKNEAVLGVAVSHGCVRLGAENLEKLYHTVPVGAKVYIY